MKQKIGVISIHEGVTFGSSLQAIALQKHLMRTAPDRDVEIINYIPPRVRLKSRFAAVFSGGEKAAAHKAIWFARFQVNNERYKRFLKQHARISPALYSADQLKERYAGYDCLITGSDQVWNSDYNRGVDPAYFLRVASEGTKKLSYAASCGKDGFSDEEWSTIREYLSDFTAISLRERSAVQMFEDAGIPGGQFVLDPTFLFNRNDWGAYEKADPECPKNYLLIYVLDIKGEKIVELAKRIARHKNLKTVLIASGQSGKARREYGVDYVAHNKTPDVYIDLFRNASYVVTNSFHGVAFSINMERQFVAVKRDRYNTRLDSILGALGLTDRYAETDEAAVKDDIDYTMVNERKAALVDASKAFLNKALGVGIHDREDG